MSKPSPFRYFKTSPEIIRLAVMLYVRFPLSLRNVEDLLHEGTVQLFGVKRRAGKVAQLRQAGREYGFEVEVLADRAGQGGLAL